MPGPNSAPNGDSKLVHGMTTIRVYESEEDRTAGIYYTEPISVREKLRRQHKLVTGKTQLKHKR